jgi:type IX secretion system PorP/SprF family membrane protein
MIKYFITLCLILFFLFGKGQDPQFSQFYAAPLYLGPSFAGNADGIRLTTNFRDQWPRLPGEFVTYAAGVDTYFEDFRSGLGAYIMHDRAGGGLYNYSTFAAQYAFNAKITKELFFKPGLEVSYNQRYIDFYSIQFTDQMNRTFDGASVPNSIEAPPTERFNQFDFSTSFMVYSIDYWVGASVNHLLSLHKSVSNSEFYAPLKVSFYGGYKLDLNNSGLRSRRSQENLFFSFYFKTNENRKTKINTNNDKKTF